MKTIKINVKKKTLNQESINTLIKHNPDFYQSILESAERGELWGLSIQRIHFIQLQLDLDSCKNS